MRKVLFILFITVGYMGSLHAQKKYVYEDSTMYQTEEPPVEAPIEETVTGEKQAEAYSYKEEEKTDTVLHFNKMFIEPDSIKAWGKQKGFAYMSYIDSLLKSRKKDEKEKPKFEMKEPSGPSWIERLFASSFVRWFFWILAGGFVLFIIYRLFLAEGIFKKSSAKANTTKQPAVEEEVITAESDFDRLIRQAIAAGNFRLAVRYQYLKTLHLLAEKNYVQMAVDKTNFMYVQEIKNYDMQNAFARLTLNYEYVWYGEFTIDGVIYSNMENGFKSFNAKI